MAVRLRPSVDGKVTDKEHWTGQGTQSAMPLIDGNSKEGNTQEQHFLLCVGKIKTYPAGLDIFYWV